MILLAHHFFQINRCIHQFRPKNITKKSNITILSNYIKFFNTTLVTNNQPQFIQT